MAKVLIALGGNALGNTPSEQKEAVKKTAEAIANLVENQHEVIVCHGNGPQVGMINNAFDLAFKNGGIKETVPLVECGAMSQGYIGFHLQNAIQNIFKKKNINKNVATIVTQTIVDKNDAAFVHPTKPVGNFMDKATAEVIAKENNWQVVEDSGRGWRRVVPSPKPIGIVEQDAIKALLKEKFVVIAGGGGGVPVYDDHGWNGIDAVIDKDFTSAKMAELIDADVFIVLTAVPKVMINFGKENQKAISKISINQLMELIKQNQFAPGSMLPKIKATMSFTQSTSKPSYIGELKDAIDIIEGKTGTKIII